VKSWNMEISLKIPWKIPLNSMEFSMELHRKIP
jgi:hypothetical protein